MWRSLRFRLPALFLAGVVLAGLIAAAIAFRLFQDFAHDQALGELRREGVGISKLYEDQAKSVSDEGKAAPEFAAANLERATGDRIFYVGEEVFIGQASGLTTLHRSLIPWSEVQGEGRTVQFKFVPPGESKEFLAIAHPLRLGEAGTPPFGAIVVAKPQTALTERLTALLGRLALAFLGGILVAGALGWYLSRRITGPVLALSKATDEVAAGRYDVSIEEVPGGGEIAHLAERFRGMAARLQEAEELERNFLMTVSHELRTPLTAIRGHVEALREGLVLDEESRAESLEVVAAETARLERLVGDVLDLARMRKAEFSVRRETIDLRTIAQDALRRYESQARDFGVTLDVDGTPTAPALADADRALQIVSNLVENALRLTPAGGSVRIRATPGELQIEDTGPGLEAEELARAFERFYLYSRYGRERPVGTGLGLAIVKELAEGMGGSVEAASSPGQRTVFTVRLPLAGPLGATPAESELTRA